MTDNNHWTKAQRDFLDSWDSGEMVQVAAVGTMTSKTHIKFKLFDSEKSEGFSFVSIPR